MAGVRGTNPCVVKNLCVTFDSLQNLTAYCWPETLLMKSQLAHISYVIYIYYILYSYIKLEKRKYLFTVSQILKISNVIEKN